jgi:hypothetical protein
MILLQCSSTGLQPNGQLVCLQLCRYWLQSSCHSLSSFTGLAQQLCFHHQYITMQGLAHRMPSCSTARD